MSEYDILAKYEGLRLTDVCDGMDALRRQDIGLVAGDIRPLWRDIDNFSHRFCGLAYTVRFMPTARPVDAYEPEDFETWKGNWYRTYAGGPPVDEIQKGDVIVIDGGEIGTVGFIGSNNGFAWIAAGAVGIVTNGGARDTDELIKQRVPVYSRRITQSIRPGRLELDSTQIPVNIGGVLVRPKDLVLADGDGVIVVPLEIAAEVAKHAWVVADGDKRGRRRIYERMGREPDWTVDV
ncbi:MAG: RraA family protein [Chloroflexota bacterium]|nr:RraA family protein [Chloroflexota bacterium]